MTSPNEPAPKSQLTRPIESLTIGFDEARQLTGLSRNTFYRLVKNGEIPGARKLGGTWRFYREKLVGFLACEDLGDPSKPRRR